MRALIMKKKHLNLYIGIDPGWSGCLVFIQDKNIRFFDCPKYASGMALIVNQIIENFYKPHNIYCYIEKVHTIDKWSKQSGDKLMINYGMWHGIFAAHNIKLAEVLPMTWQKYMVNKIHTNPKENSLETVERIQGYWGYDKWEKTPMNLCKVVGNNHNRSDALLLAMFCERTKGKLCE